ncbi:MAG: hypothetical protein KBE65_04245 [Phycisphaerae bacterium]|nr:hypothetical protein [Phycisphaerae bacterium]
MCERVKRLIRDLQREKADLARQRDGKVKEWEQAIKEWTQAHIDVEEIKAREIEIDQTIKRLNGQA